MKSLANLLISKKESSIEGINYLDQVLFGILNPDFLEMLIIAHSH